MRTITRLTTVPAILALVLGAIDPAAAQEGRAADLYATRCAGCHGLDAAAFSRESLRLEDGRAIGIRSGSEVGEFMNTHGRLAPSDARAISELLRQLALARIEGFLNGL